MLILSRLLYNYQMPSDGGSSDDDGSGGASGGGDSGNSGGGDSVGAASGPAGVEATAAANGMGVGDGQGAGQAGYSTEGSEGANVNGYSYGVNVANPNVQTQVSTPDTFGYEQAVADAQGWGSTTSHGAVGLSEAFAAIPGKPTVANADALNAFGMHATSYSHNNKTGYTTFEGVKGFLGMTVDGHSKQGQMVGFTDEMAIDALEALNINVTNLNIAATKEVAAAIMGFAFQGFSIGVALNAVAAAANIAETQGVIGSVANEDIQQAIAVVNVVSQFLGMAQVGMAISEENSLLGVAIVGLSFYGMAQELGKMGFEGSSVDIDSMSMRGDSDFSGVIHEESNSTKVQYNPILAGKQFNRQTNNSLVKPVIPIIPEYKEQKQKDGSMTENYLEYRGGLSNILAPYLIKKNEGSVFENIDIERGSLKSVLVGELKGTGNKKYIQYLEDGIHYFTSDSYFNMAKIGNFYYLTTEDASYTGVYRLVLNQNALTEADLISVDITAPTSTPTISAVITSQTYTVTATLVNIKNSSGVEETYTATVTSNYNTDIQVALESNTPLTISGTCSSGTPDGRTIVINIEGISVNTVSSSETFTVTITNLSFLTQELVRELWDTYQYAYTYYNEDTGFESIPIFTDTWLRKATSLRISNIKHISNIDVDKIKLYRIGGYSSVYRKIAEITNLHDDSLGEYVDNITDLLTIDILDTDNASDILGLKGLIEHKGTLFAFKNNQVYFSAPGKPNIWSEFNMVRVGGTITGIVSVPLGVLILTDGQQTYLLAGTTKQNFSLATLDKRTGCLDYKSVQNVANSAIWLGYEGIMISVGAAVQNISKSRVDVSDIGTIHSSFTYNSIYYLFGSNYTLAIDFRYTQPSFKKFVFSSEIVSMTSKKGTLVYVTNNRDYYEGLYSTGAESHMEYRTPAFIGQSYDLLKEFNKINIVYKGTLTYTVYVSGNSILTGQLTSTSIAVEEVQLPTQSNQGISLELGISGQGEIYSFRYIFSYLNNN